MPIKAVYGVVEEIFWYTNGIPRIALRKGSRRESDETAFSGLPLKPTNVPLRVYRFCDAEMDAERREKGVPRTSNRASVYKSARAVSGGSIAVLPAEGDELGDAGGSKLCVGCVLGGVALIWTYRLLVLPVRLLACLTCRQARHTEA